MIKPASLRAALCLAAPVLADNPDMLLMFVDRGRVVARQGSNRGFEYRYQLNVIVQNWTGDEAIILLAINDWLAVQQPDLLAPGRPDGSYAFEADIIDAATIDLSIDLQLTEAMRVEPQPGGGDHIVPVAEPDPLFSAMLGLTEPAVPLESVWGNGQQLVPGN